MSEPVDNTPPTPLAGDPAREASDSIRGYDYQFLVSVQAWLNLPNQGYLYLEGAEDIDRIVDGVATAVQVKDTPSLGPLSLNTQRAAEALENYLDIVARNPGRDLRYSYLTTSPVGREPAELLLAFCQARGKGGVA